MFEFSKKRCNNCKNHDILPYLYLSLTVFNKPALSYFACQQMVVSRESWRKLDNRTLSVWMTSSYCYGCSTSRQKSIVSFSFSFFSSAEPKAPGMWGYRLSSVRRPLWSIVDNFKWLLLWNHHADCNQIHIQPPGSLEWKIVYMIWVTCPSMSPRPYILYISSAERINRWHWNLVCKTGKNRCLMLD